MRDKMAKKIVAIVGSYRRDGTIEHAVDAILDKARKLGYELAR